MRTKYKFMGRVGGQYVWLGPRIPGDSRHVRITCGVRWFRKMMLQGKPQTWPQEPWTFDMPLEDLAT